MVFSSRNIEMEIFLPINHPKNLSLEASNSAFQRQFDPLVYDAID